MKKFLLIIVLLSFVFLRFWDIENRMQFTWDQVSNAWVMKDMLVDGKLPLQGMVAKLNSPIHIGPAYYYLLVPFYWIFHLDPVAAGVFASVVALVTAVVLFVAIRRLFSYEVALFSLAIYTFSARIIIQDRIAWPVIFLPMLAIAVFLALYKLMDGRPKYVLLLAFSLGFSLHIHFTAIFFFLYTILCLPFFIRTKGLLRYIVPASVIFLVWFAPIVVAGIGKSFVGGNMLAYFQTYYHGFHFVRVSQLLGDALIEFVAIIGVPQVRVAAFFALPAFLFLFWQSYKKKIPQVVRMAYLTGIWFVVPLVIFAVYSGEISDYYFTVTRPIVAMIYGWLTVTALQRKNVVLSVAVVLFWGYILFYNMNVFFRNNFGNHVPKLKIEVKGDIEKGKSINFTEGDPKSYLYYIYAQYEK